MVVFAGQGDARRSMALLWRAPEGERGARSAPGPRPGLSVDVIVDAAIAVADAEGMAALSMRAVGERLGRTAMALYTYVPGKAELVDLMYDRALAELPTRYDLSVGWRAAVTAWVRDLWDFHLRHPWTLQVSHARPVLGPGWFTMSETMMAVLRTTGLDARTLRGLGGTLTHLVRDAARIVAETRLATQETGKGEDEWWYAHAPQLDELVPDFGARFPTLTWMESQHAFDMDDAETPYLVQEATEVFEAGLALVLDGIEVRIRRAGGDPDH
ncbi:TetR/AcrR family transcriptional regulator [Actinomadura miaoliensis]|uniref:TetR/AcrR family transcriptional regulator C-terminal domain-containing protein n=1 Tax=Actinomadura miaoliensis TaxID=430685 RepID=A0ABP7W2P9_9ACTN